RAWAAASPPARFRAALFPAQASAQAVAAGLIAGLHGLLVAGKEDLVGRVGQVGTAGQVELLGIDIADVGLDGRLAAALLAAAVGQGGVLGLGGHVLVRGDGIVDAVAGDPDGARQVGAPDVHPRVAQAAEGGLVGVA